MIENTEINDLLCRFQYLLKLNENKIKIISNGGHGNLTKKTVSPGLYCFSKENLSKLENNQPILISLYNRCNKCGEWLHIYFDGKSVWAANKCEFAKGITNFSVSLNVPSGKMVLANDLRRWFRVHADYDVNTKAGIKKTMVAYEKIGMAHGFLGNDGSKVYQKNRENLTIGKSQGRLVGSIITNLWWYCAVDFEDFKTRFLDSGTIKEFEEYLEEKCFVVTVKPGLYKFERFDNKNLENNSVKIFWFGDPVNKDLYQEYKNLNYTLGQVYLVTVSAWPDLFGIPGCAKLPPNEMIKYLETLSPEIIEYSVHLVYEQIFCDDKGRNWHQNGWTCNEELDETIPDFQLPKLTKSYDWELKTNEIFPCALYLAATEKKSFFGFEVNFNESFLDGALEVLKNINHNEFIQTCLDGLKQRYSRKYPHLLEKL